MCRWKRWVLRARTRTDLPGCLLNNGIIAANCVKNTPLCGLYNSLPRSRDCMVRLPRPLTQPNSVTIAYTMMLLGPIICSCPLPIVGRRKSNGALVRWLIFLEPTWHMALIFWRIHRKDHKGIYLPNCSKDCKGIYPSLKYFYLMYLEEFLVRITNQPLTVHRPFDHLNYYNQPF